MSTNDWRTKDYLKPRDIKEILNISPGKTYDLINSLPHIRVGKSIRIPRLAFEKWLRDQERKMSS